MMVFPWRERPIYPSLFRHWHSCLSVLMSDLQSWKRPSLRSVMYFEQKKWVRWICQTRFRQKPFQTKRTDQWQMRRELWIG